MSKSGKSTTLATTFFFIFFIFVKVQLPTWRLIIYMHKTADKSLWKEDMSYGGDTWYMGRIYEELNNYTCVWLISICIIN